VPPSFIFTEKYGSLSATGVAKETIFGTPVAATTTIPTASNTMVSDPGLFYPDLMQAIRDKQVYPLQGEEKDAGAITAPLFPSNGMTMLVGSVGADVVTGAGPYTHTVTPGTTLPSFTVEKNIGNFQSLQFAGSRVSKLQIKGAMGNKEAEMTADIVSQSVSILTTPSAIVVANESPFVAAEFALSYGGYSIGQATNFQLDIENGLKETYTFNGTHQLQFLTPASLKVSGSFDVVFDVLNNNVVTGFTYTTTGTNTNPVLTSVTSTVGITAGMGISGANIPAGAIIIGVTSNTITMNVNATAAGTLQTGTASNVFDYFYQASAITKGALSFSMTHPANGGSITFNMPSVNLAKTDQKIAPGAVVMETISFEAFYDLSTGTPKTIQMVVVNGVSGAY